MDKELSYNAGMEALRNVQSLHPKLVMQIDENNPNVDINMDIPVQSGLDFDINLNLQNIDELHLSVGKLWMCWFPCTEVENSRDFVQTISGLIKGRYRILETIKRGKVVKAQLQYQQNGSWVSRSSGLLTFSFPSLGSKSFKVVQNGQNS